MAKKTTKTSKTPRKATQKASASQTQRGRVKAAKRTLIKPKADKRYVRRGATGRFSESDDVGKSASADRRRKAKRKSTRGQGDKGDR